jgi:hypothetical protein
MPVILAVVVLPLRFHQKDPSESPPADLSWLHVRSTRVPSLLQCPAGPIRGVISG